MGSMHTQFYQSGCENCGFLRLEGDQDRCSECTTPHFQGMISYIDPPASWTAKWTHTSEFLCPQGRLPTCSSHKICSWLYYGK